jgi:hypothetical protein
MAKITARLEVAKAALAEIDGKVAAVSVCPEST